MCECFSGFIMFQTWLRDMNPFEEVVRIIFEAYIKFCLIVKVYVSKTHQCKPDWKRTGPFWSYGAFKVLYNTSTVNKRVNIDTSFQVLQSIFDTGKWFSTLWKAPKWESWGPIPKHFLSLLVCSGCSKRLKFQVSSKDVVAI